MSDRLGLTANYTWLDASISDPTIIGLRITDIPTHQAYLALDWQATDTLTLTPSVEIYGSRWSDPAAGQPRTASPTYSYIKTGGFALANLRASWQVSEKAAIDFGIRNLLDRDVQIVAGYPEAGRSFFLASQIKF